MRRLAFVPFVALPLFATFACDTAPPTDPDLQPAFAKPVTPPVGSAVLANAFVTADSGLANTNIASNPSALTFATYRPANTGSIFRTSIEIDMAATREFLFGAAGDSSNCVYDKTASADATKRHNMRQLLKSALVDGVPRDRHFSGSVDLANPGVPSDLNVMTVAWPNPAGDGSELWLRFDMTKLNPPGTSGPVCTATGYVDPVWGNPAEWTCQGSAVNFWHRAGPQVSNGVIACHAAPGEAWTVRIHRLQ